MLISKNTKEALHRWIAIDTWYKLDKSDEDRFYGFVKLFWEDYRNLPSPISDPDIEEILTKEIESLHPGLMNLEGDDERLRRFVSRIRDIIDYSLSTEDIVYKPRKLWQILQWLLYRRTKKSIG
jgi:hypothetical protein